MERESWIQTEYGSWLPVAPYRPPPDLALGDLVFGMQHCRVNCIVELDRNLDPTTPLLISYDALTYVGSLNDAVFVEYSVDGGTTWDPPVVYPGGSENSSMTWKSESMVLAIPEDTVRLRFGTTVWNTFVQLDNIEISRYTSVDTIPPTFDASPEDVSVASAGGAAVPVYFEVPEASDDLDPLVDVVSSHSSGSMFPVGTTQATFTASDDFGNSSTHTMSVTVTSVPATEGVVFADDFGGPNYWEYAETFPPTDMARYYPLDNYSFAIDGSVGNPAPSGLITGYGEITSIMFSRTMDISGIGRSQSLFVGFDFIPGGVYQNGSLHIDIKGDDGASVYSTTLSGDDLRGRGWKSFSHDISSVVGENSSVTVEPTVRDTIHYYWERYVYFDNFYLGHGDPLSMRGAAGASLPFELSELGAAELLGMDPRDLTRAELRLLELRLLADQGAAGWPAGSLAAAGPAFAVAVPHAAFAQTHGRRRDHRTAK